jgi:hypothetical protein
MPFPVYSLCRRAALRLGALALLGIAAACGGSDQTSPSNDGDVALSDTLVTPADSTASIPTDSLPADSLPIDSSLVPQTILAGTGIPFGVMNMRANAMTSLYKASQLGIEPPYLLDELRTAKGKGGRFVLKMAGKTDEAIQNADGTFSLTKWKALVDRYRQINFSSYITDGTLIGHFLIDEPENANKWGGKPLTQATVEAMAQYSKSIWRDLPTIARTPPSWLARSTMTYTYLDAGWTQYVVWRGDALSWIRAETAAAQTKGLGLIAGLNVLDGGNGSSKIRGWLSYRWSMTATEIRTYGAAMLSSSLSCAFMSWTYLYQGATYFARSDINSAMVDLSNKARAHAPSSCIQ